EIASKVSSRKRISILERAQQLNIRVTNSKARVRSQEAIPFSEFAKNPFWSKVFNRGGTPYK
ncbi:17196_t:CDS:2, partial [Entrophospora sp. SA101]